MTGFDLYEQWRSALFQDTEYVAISWDALEVWERAGWEAFAKDGVKHIISEYIRTRP